MQNRVENYLDGNSKVKCIDVDFYPSINLTVANRMNFNPSKTYSNTIGRWKVKYKTPLEIELSKNGIKKAN